MIHGKKKKNEPTSTHRIRVWQTTDTLWHAMPEKIRYGLEGFRYFAPMRDKPFTDKFRVYVIDCADRTITNDKAERDAEVLPR